MNKRNYGKTRFEIMIVMLLLIIFGISTYTLVLATTTSYEKSQNENAAKDNLRLASSYIDSKIKNFEKRNIRVKENLIGETNAIVLEEDIQGQIYQTVIYFKEKTLKEIFVQKGADLEDDSGFEIAKLEDMEIEKIRDGMLTVSFYTKANKENYKTQTIVNLN